MRGFIFFAVIVWFGCGPRTSKMPMPMDQGASAIHVAANSTEAVPVILMTDPSGSDTFIYPDTATLGIFLSRYLFTGVELTALCVLADSYKQTCYYYRIPTIDTLPNSSNFIIDRHHRLENKQRIAQSSQILKPVLDSFYRQFLQIPHGARSDVANALRKVAKTASNKSYANRKVLVILASDLVQDLIPNREERIKPIHFPSNVQLVVIESHPSVDLDKLFPGQTPIELPSFQHLQTLSL